jgi:TolB-like protein
MGVDDSGTLAALKAHRRELIDPKIAEHSGRIVKTTGDGLLLEFPSVVDAVRCAVEVQQGMAERNQGIGPDRRLDFRIGINVGDIIIDGDDIFGDGVNVAARLEALAEPGGICVSRVVRDQVLDKLSFTFEDLGAQQVKNIARPVDVYRVNLGSVASQAHSPGRKPWWRLTRATPWRWRAAGAFALVLGAIGAWWMTHLLGPASVPTPPLALFAIMPFEARTANPVDAQSAEGLAADLTSSLQRSLPDWPAVSSSIAGTYKGKTIDARVVGRELNVRYLVDGEIRAVGEQVMVKARITETSMDTELWSDELELQKVGYTQNRQLVVARLANQVKSALIDAERRRVLALPISALNSDELTQRADAIWQRDPESLTALTEARSLYDKALRLNPELPAALMSQAYALSATLDLDPHADRDRVVREYDQMSVRLIAVADREARAWNIRADALRLQWRWEAALEANARAQKLDPARTNTMGQRAHILIDMGRPEDAFALVDQGLSLQPGFAGAADYILFARCRANLALGRYDDAIGACEIAASQDSLDPHIFLVAAYALQGNDARAQAERTKLLTKRPRFSIADLKARRTSDVPAYLQQTETHLFAGLRKADIPEG